MEKKNTGLIVLVVILSLLVAGLGGFIVYDKVLNTKENNNVTTNEETKIFEKVDEKKDIVYTEHEFKVTGYYPDKTISSKIPQININSDFIKEINDEIITTLKIKMETETFKNNYHYTDPDGTDIKRDKIYNIDYEYYVKDNFLSLVVSYEHLTVVGLPKEYMIYNIDLKNNVKLYNSDIIKKIGYTIDSVESEIRNKITNHYKSPEYEEYPYMSANIYSTLEVLIQENEVYLPMYIDKNSKLHVLIYVPSLGDSIWSYKNIELF